MEPSLRYVLKVAESGGMTCVKGALSCYSPHEEGEGTGPDINKPKQLPPSLSPPPLGDGERKLMERERGRAEED